MQVIPWSETQENADGYDHGFLFGGDLDWLLRTYCLVIRERWPRAILCSGDDVKKKSKSYRAPALPRTFPRHGTLLIHRDEEMVNFSDDHGQESDAAGESYLLVWIWPNPAGAHLDLVTAEPFSHPFTSWAVGTLVQLIGWWHHVSYDRQNKPHCMPPGRGVLEGGKLRFVGSGGAMIQPRVQGERSG